MNCPWSDYVIGSFSLFPLWGTIEKLKDFFPTGFRSWFVTFSTIFSLVIYIYVQWFFEKLEGLPFFIPWWVSGPCALVFLPLYILILPSQKKKFKNPSKKKASYIIPTMIVYILLILSLTYTFNVMENLNDYYVFKGYTTYNEKRIEQKVKIVFWKEGKSCKTIYSNNNGNFFAIIKKEKYKQCQHVIFSTERSGITLGSTQSVLDLPLNQDWVIPLKPAIIDN